MHTVASKGVQEYRQGSHKGFTLTRSHLGNLALVQGYTTKYLNIVVHHFPFQVVATRCPVVMIDSLIAINRDKVFLGVGSQFAVKIVCGNDGFLVFSKTSSRIFHNAESYRHHLVQCLLINLQRFFLQLVDGVEDAFALVDGRFFNLSLQLGNFVFLLFCRVLNILLYLLGFSAQFIIRQRLDGGISLFYLLNEWLYKLHVASRLIPEQRL